MTMTTARRLAGCLFFLSLALCLWSESWRLTVLHTNDLHGQMLPFNYPGAVLSQAARQDAGGLARRATAIARIRREVTDHPVALVEAGDIFTRGPWHTRFYGEPEVEAMNLMGYEMMTIGNNEFKAKNGTESQAIMLSLLKRSKFPWLAANLTVGDTGQPVEGVKPYVVKTYGAMRVGFLGLTAPRAQEYSQVKGWTIGDPIAAAKKWAPVARKECDILIALTHIGDVLDRQLAAQVTGIDAIVGGDSHTFLFQPVKVKNPDGIEVPIAQAGEMGILLGRLDLTFEQQKTGWRLTACSGQLLPIDKQYIDAPDIKALLDRYLAPPAQPQQQKIPVTRIPMLLPRALSAC